MTQKPPHNFKGDITGNNRVESNTGDLSDPSTSNKVPSLVPIGITIGLAVFTLILVLAGYGFRLAFGDNLDDVIKHAIVIVPIFVIGIPFLFWIGGVIMNKYTTSNVQTRNSLSLGFLISSVTILWLMGTYS